MKKTALIGGTKAFRSFLSQLGKEFVQTTVDEAIFNPDYTSILLLPDYEHGQDTVSELTLAQMERLAERKRHEKLKLYAENYYGNNFYNHSLFGYDVLGGVCHTRNEALLAQNELEDALDGAQILQAANVKYLPAVPMLRDFLAGENKVLLSLGWYAGTTKVNTTDVERAFPMLIQTGTVLSALFSLSNFDRVNMRPNARFKKLFGYIFSFILDVDKEKVEEAFAKIYPPIQTRFPLNATLPTPKREIFEQAVRSAVQWHFDAGIILGAHGEDGAVEMIMSNNGQKLYNNRRVDAGFYTGWLLYAAGKYFRDDEWILTGKNIFYYFFDRAQLHGGIVEGMYDWYYNKDAAPNEVYSIDLGRDGIALCNMYALTGDEKILQAIENLALSVDKWIEEDRLLTIHISYVANGKEKHLDDGHLTPAVLGELSMFMQMASLLLKKDALIKKMKRVCDRLLKAYPNYSYYGHTTSSRMARLLMVLLPVHIAGEADYSEMINKQIDYFESISLPCGGIYSEDNLSYGRHGSKASECGITTPWDTDKISDQLYCVNNILVALSLLKKVDDKKINKEKGLKIFQNLLDYVVKIQIVSEDKRFNGGWMRAYSMTQEEYYGLDADAFWGSYCIMAGWTMGMIPLALLYELQDECL